MSANEFLRRHIGPSEEDVKKMLGVTAASSIDELIDQTIPASIRMKKKMELDPPMSEREYIDHITALAGENKIFRSFIGLGYYNTLTPTVIQRNILENPGWYTAYTPYQAEISQGRLEALLNYQTMVSDLTGFPIANSSLLDEGTAAAEAMIMFFNSRSRDAVKRGVNKFFISSRVFPHTIDVLKTRAIPLGIELICGCHCEFEFTDQVFGALIQYPAEQGKIYDYTEFVKKAHAVGANVAVAADLMSLALLTPPAEWGADAALGSTQRFGIPMGFGGPHAAYFAVKEDFKRSIPGRIIGISVDAQGNRALRMALQTREQHIKREKATSNICTAQALLAIMAGFYAAYHGKDGIKCIAKSIHAKTIALDKVLTDLGCTQENPHYFDTLKIKLSDAAALEKVRTAAIAKEINFRYFADGCIGISLDEATQIKDLNDIAEIFASALNKKANAIAALDYNINRIPETYIRQSSFLEHEVFNSHHSETEMMRYMKKLEYRDLALNRSMIPLGSCTMKLNAATEMLAVSFPQFANMHPFVPAEQAQGYLKLIEHLNKDLCAITGFDKISFQPNSGAAGEYTGLMVIREYHVSRGDIHRNVALIPSSAHGTNPASAIMAGMQVVVVKCDDQGNIDINDLRMQAEKHKDDLSCLMATYPSTHGVFEENILDIFKIIHDNGGQVYMDGANMNAQVGFTNPATIGADVCHLNLHKTFAIPHGGGGPGVGPIGVAKHLTPFLPKHAFFKTGGEKGIDAVSSAPFGSALVLSISYAYIKMMGAEGLTDATRYAIFNANYLKSALEKHFPILYTGSKGRVAHEMILDCNNFKKTAGLEVIDIAKRLMDYGFHAPTVAFPVHGTLMVEPTESEPLVELDRFIEAMVAIRKEIEEIEKGQADQANNVIHNAPHTQALVVNDTWDKPYSRMKAAFPVKFEICDKYWPAVARIDDAFGDRNLVCSCQG